MPNFLAIRESRQKALTYSTKKNSTKLTAKETSVESNWQLRESGNENLVTQKHSLSSLSGAEALPQRPESQSSTKFQESLSLRVQYLSTGDLDVPDLSRLMCVVTQSMNLHLTGNFRSDQTVDAPADSYVDLLKSCSAGHDRVHGPGGASRRTLRTLLWHLVGRLLRHRDGYCKTSVERS